MFSLSYYCYEKFSNSKTNKWIDVTILNNELDMLEFRLKEHNDIVDHWIIVESGQTFSGKSKNMYLKENLDTRFKQWKNKIIHVEFTPNKNKDAWWNEHATRLEGLKALKQLNLNDDDIVTMSDIDEIFDIKQISSLKYNFPSKDTLIIPSLRMFYYHPRCEFNSSWSRRDFFITQYKIVNDPDFILENINKMPITIHKSNMGWHFSYFMTLEGIQNKLNSFSHYNDKEILLIKDKTELIKERVLNCIDLFDRGNPHGDTITDNIKDLPKNINLIDFWF